MVPIVFGVNRRFVLLVFNRWNFWNRWNGWNYSRRLAASKYEHSTHNEPRRQAVAQCHHFNASQGEANQSERD